MPPLSGRPPFQSEFRLLRAYLVVALRTGAYLEKARSGFAGDTIPEIGRPARDADQRLLELRDES